MALAIERLKVGTRVRLLNDEDRYPHGICPKGSTGIIESVEVARGLIYVRMEQHFDWLQDEDWDNVLQFLEERAVAREFCEVVEEIAADVPVFPAEPVRDAVEVEAVTVLPDSVTRYVPTYVNGAGMRTLMNAAQGRYTWSTFQEAAEYMAAVTGNNSAATVRQIWGDNPRFEVRPVACWPGHFDPKTIWFD